MKDTSENNVDDGYESIPPHEGSSHIETSTTSYKEASMSIQNPEAMTQSQASCSLTSLQYPSHQSQELQQAQNQYHKRQPLVSPYATGGGRGGDARSVYSSATSVARKLIVFATPAKYTPLAWFLMAIPLLAIIVSIIFLHPRTDYKNSSTAWVLEWTLLLVMVLYMAILPKQIDVRSNGTVGIKTFLLTFHIDGVVRAYQAGIGREDFLRPRIKFGTSFEGRVILRRNHGKWDVVVTPEDVEGFLKAVEQMIKEHSDETSDCGDVPDAENNIVIVPNTKQSSSGMGKPNLASTDQSTPPVFV